MRGSAPVSGNLNYAVRVSSGAFKGPVMVMCIKNLDFPKVSLSFEKAI